MSLTKVIARYAPGIGLLLLGPVSTMIMSPGTLGDSYVFGVIDGLLAVFAIMSWSSASSTTSKNPDVVG